MAKSTIKMFRALGFSHSVTSRTAKDLMAIAARCSYAIYVARECAHWNPNKPLLHAEVEVEAEVKAEDKAAGQAAGKAAGKAAVAASQPASKVNCMVAHFFVCVGGDQKKCSNS